VPAEPAPQESFVRSACRLGPVPEVTEIRLHLAEDVMGLWQRTEDELGTGQPPPFWAFAWPGGQALARYVLDHPGLVAGRRVLDLGSGSGLVAIAAAMAGAAAVVARARGASVLTGDVGRAFLPRDRFRVLDTRDIAVLADLEDASVKPAMVWAMLGP